MCVSGGGGGGIKMNENAWVNLLGTWCHDERINYSISLLMLSSQPISNFVAYSSPLKSQFIFYCLFHTFT